MTPHEAIVLAAVLIIAAITEWAGPVDATTLARVRERLLASLNIRTPVVLPPGPADDTRPLPHAVGTWGKTVTQLVDEMAAEYLEVKR
jgi:hypothetical protein